MQILSTLIGADGGTASVMGHDLLNEADAVREVIGSQVSSPRWTRCLLARRTCCSWADCCTCGPQSGITSVGASAPAWDRLAEIGKRKPRA